MEEPVLVANPQNVIPYHWRGVYVMSDNDLISLGAKNLGIIKQYWEEKFNDAVSETEKCKICLRLEYIDSIMEVPAAKEVKPYLACARPKDWIKVEDEVYYYHQEPSEVSSGIPSTRRLFDDGVFLVGQVTEIQDSSIGVNLSSTFTDYLGNERKEFWFDEWHSPFVMNKWEYVYLKDHPTYAETWAKIGMSWCGALYVDAILNAPIY